MKALEEKGGYTQDQLVTELGRLLRMPVLRMEDLHALTPVFEKLSFTEAITQECALFIIGIPWFAASRRASSSC